MVLVTNHILHLSTYLSLANLQYSVSFKTLPPGSRMMELGVHWNDTHTAVAGIDVILRRQTRPYVQSLFVPSATLVYVSMISFIIPYNAIPGTK